MSKEFKISQLFLTENNCYKSNRKHKIKGIMWHSTGANNPFLSRYIGPDDGVIGENKYNNHWNRPGLNVCVHAFIGKDKDGQVKTYQTLPWNLVGWHSGRGWKGSANRMGYIGFEICEDGLSNREYFNEVYEEAIDLSVYLCKRFNLQAEDIIDHQEGHKLGIASNHGDVKHWFSKFGKTMDDVRREVDQRLKGDRVMAELKSWQKNMGEQSLDSLNKKGLVHNPEGWKETLAEGVDQWLFWTIIDRITEER